MKKNQIVKPNSPLDSVIGAINRLNEDQQQMVLKIEELEKRIFEAERALYNLWR